jgi:hypothetical protein
MKKNVFWAFLVVALAFLALLTIPSVRSEYDVKKGRIYVEKDVNPTFYTISGMDKFLEKEFGITGVEAHKRDRWTWYKPNQREAEELTFNVKLDFFKKGVKKHGLGLEVKILLDDYKEIAKLDGAWLELRSFDENSELIGEEFMPLNPELRDVAEKLFNHFIKSRHICFEPGGEYF